MQISDEHVVVVVVRRVVVVVVVVVPVVVVVVVSSAGSDAVVVVVVVVVVVELSDDPDLDEDDDVLDGAEPRAVAVVVGPADREAGGIGSTAPSSDGSRLGRSVLVRAPNAKRVQVIAPTTAPTANRP
jgi:hypothetical protein